MGRKEQATKITVSYFPFVTQRSEWRLFLFQIHSVSITPAKVDWRTPRYRARHPWKMMTDLCKVTGGPTGLGSHTAYCPK